MINGKYRQVTHNVKMCADKSAKKTPNALKSICSNCMPIPKVWDFDEKKGFSRVSLVRGAPNFR